MQPINLSTPLTVSNAFRYPLQSAIARREVIIGGLWLLVPVVGWLLNMGHRIMMVHKMQNGQSAWPSWNNYGELLKHGFLTFLGMVEYHLPAMIMEFVAWKFDQPILHALSIILWIIATLTVPGYMSHYCFQLDASEIFNPAKALKRVMWAGRLYWKAWDIALLALCISFTGLLLLGIGFIFTSVWF